MSGSDWTLARLARAAQADLAACHTDLERQLSKVVNDAGIRAFAAALAAQRKLTAAEMAIAAAAGYRASLMPAEARDLAAALLDMADKAAS